jgi:DNA-binding transcriptional MerR regulator
MAEQTHALTVWRTEHSLLTLEDLACVAGLNPELVDTFVRYRLVEPAASTGSRPLFSFSSVERLQRILRLRHDLGVNLAGVGVILEMTERIEDLQREIDVLRRHSTFELQTNGH